MRFDLVILDVMMPGKDGFEVLKGIRDAPVVGATPVAMYSAINDSAAIERAIAMGANEWVVKGTLFSLLQQRLAWFLNNWVVVQFDFSSGFSGGNPPNNMKGPSNIPTGIKIRNVQTNNVLVLPESTKPASGIAKK